MGSDIRVYREGDKQKVRSILEMDRIWGGYAICDLEEELFTSCDWYTAYRRSTGISLCMYFNQLQPPAQISIGEPMGLEKILETANIPKEIHGHIPLNHLEVVKKHYHLSDLHSMKRMAVTIRSFKDANGKANRLGEKDLPELTELYSAHPSNFFRPYMLTSGVYYGLRINNTLVSAAGTHVCSPSHGLACIGNVFTHPSHQGKGYATICTNQVVKELLTRYQDVLLNVDSQNTAAIKIYRKLGFREHCTYIEAKGKTMQQ